MVGWKHFVPQLYQFQRGISGGPALEFFYTIHRGGRIIYILTSYAPARPHPQSFGLPFVCVPMPRRGSALAMCGSHWSDHVRRDGSVEPFWIANVDILRSQRCGRFINPI